MTETIPKVSLDYNTVEDMTNFVQFVMCENCSYEKECNKLYHSHNIQFCDVLTQLIARH